MRRVPISLLLAGVLLVGGAAAAFSPGPSTRIGLLPLGTCQGGAQNAKPCLADVDCADPAVPAECTTELADVAVRGVLTLIADKDSGGFDDTSAVPQQKDAAGTPIPLDLTKSTLTVMLEFTRNGQQHVLTETYKGLTDYADPALLIDCKGFCVPTWREPAVEARIASPTVDDDDGDGGGGGGGSGGGGGQQAGGTGIRIQWAPGGAAMQRALVAALGLPEGSVAFLERVNDTEAFDHSQQADVLASVRRMKVTIRAILPADPP